MPDPVANVAQSADFIRVTDAAGPSTAAGFQQTARRALHLAAIFAVAFAAAALVHLADAIVHGVISGTAIDFLGVWPIRLTGHLGDAIPYLAAAFAGEIVLGGWKNSSAAALLNGSASSRSDIWYFAFRFAGLNAITLIVASFGTSTWLERGIFDGTSLDLAVNVPFFLGFPLLLSVASFMRYWMHRLLHQPVLWPIHAVHHAAESFNLANSYRIHPLEVFTNVIIALPIGLIGFSDDAIAAAVLWFSVEELYNHSRLPSHPAQERWLTFGPRLHGLHHSADPRHFNCNFGDFPIWDRLFGTFLDYPAEPVVLGVSQDRALYVDAHPLRAMVMAEWRVLTNLAAAIRRLWPRLSATGRLSGVRPDATRVALR